MPLTVTSLASGSSGNALLVHCTTGSLLVDCGLSQRAIERHLVHGGRSIRDLQAILLTHEHSDHMLCAGPLARRYAIPLITNRPTAAALTTELAGVQLIDLPTGFSLTIGPFHVRSFPVSHDAAEPVGYVIEAEQWRVAIATDLGTWDAQVADALANGDLIVIEANHDRERLRAAPYTDSLKDRIASPRGHLDNVHAGRLLARIGVDGRKRSAWLAHLSQEANSPAIALRMVRGVLSMEGVACIDVAVMPRRTPLTWSSDTSADQLTLL
ncbi:MAG: MBL fold metallo-hydrolase [Roseiflexaceae bacterium]|nr:MBL fold metallo-hydrolase [Roseiflexaceae bacterium]